MSPASGLLENDPFAAIAEGLVGHVLQGSEGQRYPLREIIGEGGQGWVFRATWNGSVDVVVKVLRPDSASAETLARFQREADVLRTLSQQASANPHIVRFFDHAHALVEVPATGKSWDLPFTVLEFVDGITLERALEDASASGFGLERARRVLRHVVLALRDVHAHNVVHRDLKPSNILLTSAGGREIAKVTDFGLAKLLDPGMQRTVTLAGATIGYAPPEQFEYGNLRVGPHSDVFSLAAIFYELVCGLPAFPVPANAHPLIVVARILSEERPAFARVMGRLPRELADRPDVVAALDLELARALSPKPDERHASMVELHDAIDRVLSAVSATPSVPLSTAPGVVIVRKTPVPVRVSAPVAAADEVAGDDETVPGMMAPEVLRRGLAQEAANRGPSPAKGEAPCHARQATAPASEVNLEPALAWREITPAHDAGGPLAIAASATGESAVAVGPRGLLRWKGRGWSHVEPPLGVEAFVLRAAACLEDDVFLTGAIPLIAVVAAGGNVHTWTVDVPGVAFHGIHVDGRGVLAAGKRSTPGGVVGVVAEVSFGDAGGGVRVVEVPGCGALRRVTRFGAGALACGDAGAVVLIRDGAACGLRLLCERPLHAVMSMEDGTAFVVGAGAFVFQVQPTLEARLEAIQTTRDLFALARGPDGSPWCGGSGPRVLRREPATWVREGALPGAGTVRALHVDASCARAFMDDGRVLERPMP